jgi:serine/threonine protein phosphatase PrpC
MEDEIVLFGQIRNSDEDFYAVYDGHSGNESSSYASKHLHNVSLL